MTIQSNSDLPSGITFRQLQIYVATAEAGSITGAADKLYLSQTAVSLALRQLEKELGATLLIRRRARGVYLTSTGESLLPLGRNILASVADFGRSAGDNGEITGNVIVGCFPSLGPRLFPELLAAFMRQHPRAKIQFVEAGHDELMEMLEVGSVDLVLTYRLGLPVGLIEQVVEVNQLGVMTAADHPVSQGRDTISLRELADEPFIMLDSNISAEHARHVFTRTKVFPEVRFVTRNFETVRSFVGRNLGWSFTLQRPLTDTTHEGCSVRILDVIDEDVPELPTVVVRSPGLILSRTAKAFLNILEHTTSGPVDSDEYPDLLRGEKRIHSSNPTPKTNN